MPLNMEAVFKMADAAVAATDAQMAALQERQRDQALTQKIEMLPIEALVECAEEMQCFRAASDKRLEQLTENIRHNGILAPLLVRPMDDGIFEIIAGRNRHQAAKRLNYRIVPCIIKDVGDDDATELGIADNWLHREKILPSEKARSYKKQLDIMKRQGYRSDLTSTQFAWKSENSPTCAQIEHKLNGDVATTSNPTGWKFAGKESVAIIGVKCGDSQTQVRRYIRLTYLIPPLLDMVDGGRIGLRVGAAISYLSAPSQQCIAEYLQNDPKAKLVQKAADTLRELDEEQTITPELLDDLLHPPRQRAARVLKIQMQPIRQYLPPNADDKELNEIIQKALAVYYDLTHKKN